MTEQEPLAVADVREYAQQVEQNKPAAAEHGMQPMGAAESIREDEYRGHRIVIRTSYEIAVDGRRLMGHMGVTNDGRVHYHAVPNLSFRSAIMMVRQLIDAFPDDFAEEGEEDSPPMHDHEMG